MEKFSLVTLNQKMEHFPEAQTLGELVIKNYDIVMEEIDDIYDKLDNHIFETPKTKDDYDNLFKTKKGIEEFQKNLKNFLKKLDNEKIERLRERTNELIKLLGRRNGTTNGQVSYLIEEYKTKELDNIIEVAFDNVKSYDEYKADFDIFKRDCIKAIKGKSKFEEIQNISLEVAEAYSNKLTLNNMQYFVNKQVLEDYCRKIGYIVDEDIIRIESKKIVSNLANIELTKEAFRQKLERQNKEIQAKIDAKKRKEEESLKQKEKVEDKQIEKKTEEIIGDLSSNVIDKQGKFDITFQLSMSPTISGLITNNKDFKKEILDNLDIDILKKLIEIEILEVKEN